MKYIALGPARVRVTRHINNIATCSIPKDTVSFVQNGVSSSPQFESIQFSQKSEKFPIECADCLCIFAFLLLAFFEQKVG